jgi:hypothetical protein
LSSRFTILLIVGNSIVPFSKEKNMKRRTDERRLWQVQRGKSALAVFLFRLGASLISANTPLSLDAMRQAVEKDTYVSGIVAIDLGDVIDHDLESFLDDIALKLTGSELLIDIDYTIVGLRPDGALLLRVTGDASEIIDREGDEEEEQTCCVCGKSAEGENVCSCTCPSCGAGCFNDVTLADHGVCYDCHKSHLMPSAGEEYPGE